MLKNVSKSLKEVSLKMWLDGENESLNAGFIWNNSTKVDVNFDIKLQIIICFQAMLSTHFSS
jgi:hypothetical protein